MSKGQKRYFTIILVVILMISAIVITDITFMSSFEPANTAFEEEDFSPSIPSEAGVFKRQEFAAIYAEMEDDLENGRSLNEYYQNRAYPGAPPYINHPLLSEKGIGGADCLQCHENGGFVERFKAYAPVTPHPEMLNCRQCHVAKVTESEFKNTNWYKMSPPDINQRALISSPPVIPHEIQMRENCLSCHAGPAAPREIKVSHPERINCRQCHVPASEINLTVDSLSASTSTFFRKPK